MLNFAYPNDYPATVAEVCIHGYIARPDLLDETRKVVYADEWASELIEQCEKTISDLNEYRQQLKVRYSELKPI